MPRQALLPAGSRSPTSVTRRTLRTTSKRSQVALLRSVLEIAQHGNNVLVLDHLQQSIIHFSVGDLGDHARFARFLQAGVARNSFQVQTT